MSYDICMVHLHNSRSLTFISTLILIIRVQHHCSNFMENVNFFQALKNPIIFTFVDYKFINGFCCNELKVILQGKSAFNAFSALNFSCSGSASMPAIPSTFSVAAIMRAWTSRMKNCREGFAADDTSFLTFRLFMSVRSAYIVHLSEPDEEL